MEVTKTEIRTFKARIKATKPHYVGKAINCRKSLTDGINPRYTTYLSLFIPKLTFENKQPVVMFHVGNGGGSCLVRAKTPKAMADKLEELVYTLRSDAWFDMYQHMEDISSHLILNHELLIDEQMIDTASFKIQSGLHEGETFPFLEVIEKC